MTGGMFDGLDTVLRWIAVAIFLAGVLLGWLIL